MKYVDIETGELIEFSWKSPFNHNTMDESERTGLACTDDSLTQQNQAEEADINTIVRRFGVTGQIPQIPLPPSLDKFEDIFDFQSAMNTMAEAKASFAALDPEIRNAFQNNPHLFVSQIDSMLNDTDAERREENLAVMRTWGLAVGPGPKADPTTLGDVLAAIKAQSAPQTPQT